MSDRSDNRQSIEGVVSHLDLSAYGPHSGEFIFRVNRDEDNYELLYAGIVGDAFREYSIEAGPFAGYVAMITAAYIHKKRVKCFYWKRDQNRIASISFVE
jgi:hypothetical protein